MKKTVIAKFVACLLASICSVFSGVSVSAVEPAQTVLSEDSGALCGVSLSVEFREGAPRDRFEFVNASTSEWHIEVISLRLESTAGRLVFDTEAGGKGVEVYQLFEVESGSAELEAAELPDDGGTTLDMAFSQFAAGETFMFSIDVDDQLTDSERGQIIVSDSEMAGGIVAVSLRDGAGVAHALELVFDTQSRSSVSTPAC